ncbi:MAG: three-Cys-motif partner protein TcmP [Deltaproteobacteria bacterium]|nr:three-Cys-motif partner protein TcmP [Deltaproteobacteria bacterium]
MPSVIPEAYENREQSFLKHRILATYLQAWGHKLGSRARYASTDLYYVDCFAGPWKAKDEDLKDTSVSIGLMALRDAVAFWTAHAGQALRAHAVFVEKHARAFAQLERFLRENVIDGVEATAKRGTFEEHASAIARQLGDAPAFIFVDPTGWKGAGMRHIAQLASARQRDVLVNVMFHHVNRFKDDPRKFIRDQMREFFGLGEADLPIELDEEELMSLYRENLRRRCGLLYVADLAVPHPTRSQTFFRLVVGGRHPEVVRLFRDVEARVCGELAGAVREEAKRRKGQRGGQLDLGLAMPLLVDPSHQARHQQGLENARRDVLVVLAKGPRRFADVWGNVLQSNHVTRGDVAEIVVRLAVDGQVIWQHSERRRAIKDSDLLRLGVA